MEDEKLLAFKRTFRSGELSKLLEGKDSSGMQNSPTENTPSLSSGRYVKTDDSGEAGLNSIIPFQLPTFTSPVSIKL